MRKLSTQYPGTKFPTAKERGFTLIEIAVVLVIIGLLIGGILQGTELIDNSRIKKAGGDFQGIATAYVSYQDRYQRLPGDDGNTATVQARGGDWTAVTGGNLNGALLARRTVSDRTSPPRPSVARTECPRGCRSSQPHQLRGTSRTRPGFRTR